MNINATTYGSYIYTNTKNSVSKKQDVSSENVCEKEVKKEYKNVVREYKKKHPDSAIHVDEQVMAGKNYIKNCGADNISRSDMTMDEYKAFFKKLMDNVPYDSSQINNTQIWSITQEGWEQMKNDPDYEAWVLGYNIEDRSVHFPFQVSNINIEKFGATIEEHIGQGFPKDTGNKNKIDKKEDSWWYKRNKKMEELIKEQEVNAQKKAVAKRKALYKQRVQRRAEDSYRIQQYFAKMEN